MADENDTDPQFDAMMQQEADRPDLAPPPEPDEALTPGEMLKATVESAKADAAAVEKPEPAVQAAPGLEEYLSTREKLQATQRELDEVRKAAAPKDDKPKPGLFEDPDGWEAQQQARIDERVAEAEARFRTQALSYDLEQTRTRVGDEKYTAMDKAVSEQAAKDPAFAAQLRALSPYGAGAAIEKWYDRTEAVRDPGAYERRLREKFLADPEFAREFMERQNASNDAPAGQKPATSATAAGENVVRLPPSLARQSAARAATSGDDGDDSEAAIFAAGANPRRA